MSDWLAGFLSNLSSEIALQVALLGFVGVILTTFVNFLIKSMELSFNKKKEINSEKMKYFSELEDEIFKIFETCSEYSIQGIESKINNFFKERILDTPKLAVSLSKKDYVSFSKEAMSLVSSIDKLIKDDLNIGYTTLSKLSKMQFKIPLWVISRYTIIYKVDQFIEKADLNRVDIESLLNSRREDLKNDLRNLTAIPFTLSEDAVAFEIEQALSKFNSPIKIPMRNLDFLDIQKSIREEMQYSNLKLKIYQRLFLFSQNGIRIPKIRLRVIQNSLEASQISKK